MFAIFSLFLFFLSLTHFNVFSFVLFASCQFVVIQLLIPKLLFLQRPHFSKLEPPIVEMFRLTASNSICFRSKSFFEFSFGSSFLCVFVFFCRFGSPYSFVCFFFVVVANSFKNSTICYSFYTSIFAHLFLVYILLESNFVFFCKYLGITRRTSKRIDYSKMGCMTLMYLFLLFYIASRR